MKQDYSHPSKRENIYVAIDQHLKLLKTYIVEKKTIDPCMVNSHFINFYLVVEID